MEDLLPLIIDHWHQRRRTFSEYLKETFGDVGLPSPSFHELFITQTLDGDLATRKLMPCVWCAKWYVTRFTVQRVALDFRSNEMLDTYETGMWYRIPQFLIFVEDRQLLLSERYGPDHSHRLLGRFDPEASTMELKTDFTSKQWRQGGDTRWFSFLNRWKIRGKPGQV